MANGLSEKQLAWADAYLETFNKTEAARRAKYEGNDVTLASIGYENFRKPQIQEYIKRRLDESAMSADEVLTRLADFARADISDFVTFEDGIKLPFIDLKKAKDAGKLHLVKKIKYSAQGYLEFELHDSITPLLNIGKAHGLFDNAAGSSEEKPFIVKVVYGERTNENSENGPNV